MNPLKALERRSALCNKPEEIVISPDDLRDYLRCNPGTRKGLTNAQRAAKKKKRKQTKASKRRK
ncbi:hypothetical protein KAR91_83785 [Candidatus Pacearchaeota archaeon]|nr:hypothetical protein [Candidatus Pacearchaeota archaeon]